MFETIGGVDETFKRRQDKEVVTRLLQHHKIAYAPVKGVLAHVYDDHSFVNPFEVTAYYVEKMKPFVDSLDSNMRRNFYKVINGQLFYYSVTGKKIGKAIVLILKGKVSLFTACKSLYNGFKSKYLNK